MEYKKATESDIESVFELVQATIREVYPKYYPKEVVDFFCELHNRQNIEKDIAAGVLGVLWNEDGRIVGTGSYKGNHITRVYVTPEQQGLGYGSYIMQCLEEIIEKTYDTAELDASLPACMLYEKRGYRTLCHEKWPVENGAVLVYEVMEKRLRDGGSILAKNKSGWSLLEHLNIKEEEIGNYENVTGAFAIVTVDGQFLIGYNKWRKQWEFPAGGIEPGETARQAAIRELFEETHQRAAELTFKGISRMQRPNGELCYQAVFVGTVEQPEPFVSTKEDEMCEIMLWDLKQDIGYVDECDLKIAEMVCAGEKIIAQRGEMRYDKKSNRK